MKPEDALPGNPALDGEWDWDIKTGVVIFGPQWCRLLGYTPDVVPQNIEFFFTSTHPDDALNFKRELDDCLAGKKPLKESVIRLKTKSGAFRWFLDNGKVTARDEAGKATRMVGTITDITSRIQSDEEHQRLEKKTHFLSALLQIRDHSEEKLLNFFSIVTANIAKTINVERVSIWLFDSHCRTIKCQDLFLGKTCKHESGLILAEADFPRYFEAITNHKSVVVNEAHTHPATSEFSASYLKPLGITSMLDTPVRAGNVLLGVLCCEHTGPSRQWMAEEEEFCVSAASYVMLALEREQRRIAEDSLAEMNEQLEQLVTARTEELFETEALASQMINASLDAIIMIDDTGLITRWNSQAEVIFNWSASEAIGKKLSETIIPPAQRAAHEKGFQRFLQTGESRMLNRIMEMSAIRRDGSEFPIELTITLIPIKGRRYFSAFIRDISKRKQADSDRIEAEGKFRNLFEHASVAMSLNKPIYDASGKAVDFQILKVNESWIKMTGSDPGGQTLKQAAPGIEDDSFDWVGTYCQVGITGVAISFEQTLAMNGRCYDCFSYKYEEPDHFVVAFLDITTRKQAEVISTEYKDLVQLVAAVPGQFFYKDLEHRLQNVNESHAKSRGLTCAEIEGRTDVDLGSPYAEVYFRDDDEVVRTGKPKLNILEQIHTPDGPRWVLTHKLPRHDAAGKIIGVMGHSVDVHDIKLGEEALRDANQKLKLHFDQTPMGVIEWDLNFRVTRWNPGAETIFGYSAKEAVGQHASFIIPKAFQQHVDKIWEGLLHQSGGERSSNENIRKDGKTIYCEWYNTPLVDEVGAFTGAASLVADLTERRQEQIDRELLERKMQEAQKLESLGVLTGGIAHDFNNLLTGILGNASLASLDLPPGSPLYAYIESINEGSMRAAELCKQMLAYSGRSRFIIQRINLSHLVEKTAQMLKISISKKVSLNFQLEKNLPPVEVDTTQIRQIIMNLVINASEAIGNKSGVINLTTGYSQLDRAYLDGTLNAPELEEGNYVFIEFSDNGSGMSAQTLEKIFNPFFTTKLTGRGLGLSAVLSIVRAHKGAMKVDSTLGQGTTFKLFFPGEQGAVEAPAVTPLAAERWMGRGTVLVADDEESVRSITDRMLTLIGFDSVLVHDGREAVTIFQSNPSRFALVLIDMTMPHMGGEETFMELQRLYPDVRVVLMSGYDQQEVLVHFRSKGVAGFLQKPFTIDAMRDVLQEVLSSKTDAPPVGNP